MHAKLEKCVQNFVGKFGDFLQEVEAGMGIILNVWAELISPGIRKTDKGSDFKHGNEILGLPKNYRFLLAE